MQSPGGGRGIYGPPPQQMHGYFQHAPMYGHHPMVGGGGGYLAPAHQQGVSQVAAIYKLRSRQTCDQNEMDIAAAGRSVVVAEMFGVTPTEVRNIWARKTHIEETQPWWTEHESLLHACDKVCQDTFPSNNSDCSWSQRHDFKITIEQAKNGISTKDQEKQDKSNSSGPGPRRRARTVSPQARRSASPVARRPMSPSGRVSAGSADFLAGRPSRKQDKGQIKSLQSAIGPGFGGFGLVEIGLDGMERVGAAPGQAPMMVTGPLDPIPSRGNQMFSVQQPMDNDLGEPYATAHINFAVHRMSMHSNEVSPISGPMSHSFIPSSSFARKLDNNISYEATEIAIPQWSSSIADLATSHPHADHHQYVRSDDADPLRLPSLDGPQGEEDIRVTFEWTDDNAFRGSGSSFTEVRQHPTIMESVEPPF